MNLIWRFLWTILLSRFSSPLNLFDTSSILFRVLPTDVDVLRHMNNGRYFSLLDLARIDFMIRNKMFAILKRERIYGVVASEMIRFRKSIDLFKRFQITTRVIGWDDNFFYIAHQFKLGEQLCAMSAVKICFLHQTRGRIKTKEIMTLFGIPSPPKDLPAWINNWQDVELDFNKEVKNL